MKKVLAIACLVVVFSITMAAMASAAENNWRFYLKADDGAGSFSASAMTIGVGPTAKDGNYSDEAASDAADLRFPIASTPSSVKAVEGKFLDMLWNRDIKGPRAPWTHPIYYDPDYPPYYHRKVWDLRVAGLSEASDLSPIRLQFLTISSAMFPTASISGKPIRYYLKMVDNKGVENAPANGKIWEIPIPTVHSGTPYFTLTLPTLKLTANTEGTFINEGYKMEFYQTPEPSSLLALGAGLMGLAGFASRRRRS